MYSKLLKYPESSSTLMAIVAQDLSAMTYKLILIGTIDRAC